MSYKTNADGISEEEHLGDVDPCFDVSAESLSGGRDVRRRGWDRGHLTANSAIVKRSLALGAASALC